MITPMPVSRSTSIRKGRSMGPRASCSSMVRSRLRFARGLPSFLSTQWITGP
ncbi:Uncharacterised protein [Flavonifractor plautii]|uniref:Uncharacterized protein n=1 Tax=Flavonifractor plautii TaxID=292800 RepID=A0A174SBJ0_FLAPL|nr:Uncharacterised protein [Flavonifractor plautii]